MTLAESSMTESQPASGQSRILVVDDEKDILEEMQELLENKGFSVSIASSASEALRQLAADPYLNIVISDIRMPLVDGVEMIDRTSGDPALRDRPLRFIMVTGHASLADAQRSIRANAVDFVAKPIDTEQLMQAIGRAAAQIADEFASRRVQRELDAKAETERRQRLAALAQNVTLEALVAAARGAADSAGADTSPALKNLAEVLCRTIDAERHRQGAARDADCLSVATFLFQAARRHGLVAAGYGSEAHPRGIPEPAIEDGGEALVLALKLRGADRFSLEANGNGSSLRLLPVSPQSSGGAGQAGTIEADAALLALQAAEISFSRVGATLTIEDVKPGNEAVTIAFPGPPAGVGA
jgi:CheY-like chemotaxis protein